MSTWNFKVQATRARAEAMARLPSHYNDDDRAWLAHPRTQAIIANDPYAYEIAVLADLQTAEKANAAIVVAQPAQDVKEGEAVDFDLEIARIQAVENAKQK